MNELSEASKVVRPRQCEFLMAYDRRAKAHSQCDHPAYYVWQVGDNTAKRFMCKEHGEALAGNFQWELKPIYKHGCEPKAA